MLAGAEARDTSDPYSDGPDWMELNATFRAVSVSDDEVSLDDALGLWPSR